MKLSIITINYNNKAGLQRTIDSVICQTCKDFEWIVIDGGSTDGSKQLIEQYQSHSAYWCSEPDNGIYHAMNKGIAHSSGNYLLFLNSGDCLHDKYVLKRFCDEQYDVDIVAGISVNMETGEPMKNFHSDIACQLFYDSLNHQATFIKRELFDNYRYNEENKIVSDWEFFLHAILIDGCSFIYSDMVVANFDVTGISNQSQWEIIQKEERKKVLEKYFSSYVRHDLIDYFEILSSVEYKKMVLLKGRTDFLSVFVRKLISIILRFQ